MGGAIVSCPVMSPRYGRSCAGNEGAEILEFAVSLPLLLVVAVGVFDFGSAFTVKQKVGNIARKERSA